MVLWFDGLLVNGITYVVYPTIHHVSPSGLPYYFDTGEVDIDRTAERIGDHDREAAAHRCNTQHGVNCERLCLFPVLHNGLWHSFLVD